MVNVSCIKILPEDLINKIAAGEVVERPASVVKELVENSIDAGATRITVEVQKAGKKLIRVSDNGRGMNEGEIELALQRHSTSKIASMDDLYNIQTLGFRGEALPSIASVSNLKIEPNPSGSGITIEAKDLFYNIPVRKKFLKSDATELGHIGDIVSKYALAFPSIAFELISDGKPLLRTSDAGDLLDSIISVYGVELSKELTRVDHPTAFGRIFGLISRPTLTRIDKNYEIFFVNRRYIKNFLLNRALGEGYRTLIPNNRYPVAILFIDIDPKQVDVNVHPAKREVKFQKTQEVMDAVTSAVQNTLSGLLENQNIQVSEKTTWIPEMSDVFFPAPNEGINFEVTAVQPLIPIYQLKKTYIVATDGVDLVLIDQHAAHERVLYDQLSLRTQSPGIQALLIPENLELDPKGTLILRENLHYLKELGFELEEFGNNAFIVRSIPAISAKLPAKQLIMDILAEFSDLGKSAQAEVKLENLRKLVACHSAVKAGDKLTAEEMGKLIRDLYSAQNPLTCPHGRPTLVRVTEEELKRRFSR